MNRQSIAHAALAVLPIFALSLPAEAATVGFWQFNPGAFLEDSAGNSDLTLNGTVSQVTLPGTGRGAAFPGTSPAADFAGGGGDKLVTTITPTTSSFSIEAYIHIDGGEGVFGDNIAASTSGSANDVSQIGWAFEIRYDTFGGSLTRALALVTAQGSTFDFNFSNFRLEFGRDYYVASTFDLAAQQVVFYAQDLTNGGALLSSTASHSRTALNSISTFVIGNVLDEGFQFGLDGLIDEVRLSDTVLAPDALLINAVPLPAAVWLFGTALAGLGVARRLH